MNAPAAEPRLSADFRLSIVAGHDDIDDLQHVSNIAYVRWIQDVAEAHSTSVGLSSERYEELGTMFVVRKHEIEYLLSALEGDRIELVTWVAGFRGASTERRTRILRERDGAELARATTQWAYVSRQTGRPTRIVPAVVAAFSQRPPS